MKFLKKIYLCLIVLFAVTCSMALSSKAANMPTSDTFRVKVSAPHAAGSSGLMQARSSTGFPCCKMEPSMTFNLGKFSSKDIIDNGFIGYMRYWSECNNAHELVSLDVVEKPNNINVNFYPVNPVTGQPWPLPQPFPHPQYGDLWS